MTTVISTNSTVTTATWQTLRRIHTRVTRKLDAALDHQCAIDLTTYDILDQIQRSAAVRLNDLLDSIPLSQAALSRRIEKLEDLGLLKRQPDRRDGRALALTLTNAGRNLHDAATRVHQTVIAEHLPTHLTPSRLRELNPGLYQNQFSSRQNDARTE